MLKVKFSTKAPHFQNLIVLIPDQLGKNGSAVQKGISI